ncbi:SMP-30/gluconolactonase/LRE family protein [Legionella sp. W05-934-2]|uniref:SMP-30/gluconolactonase/LRE family protein n=1 Tax=Legionella sp. W05-934-2 TaxID=1198649 RepID=UPI003462B38A
MKTRTLIDNIKFAEGLRWHNNELWFCDLWSNKIYKIDQNNKLSCQIELDDQPVALGWLSDDSMLVASLYERKLLQLKDGVFSCYADLSNTQPGYAHDFVISSQDYVYISTSGFYPSYKAKPVTSNILLITPEKEIRTAASNIRYPNGIKLIDSEKRLLVSETFAASVSEFQVSKDHSLIHQRNYYSFDNKGFDVEFDKNGVPFDLNRYYPDGICFDEKREILWVASPGRNEVVAINKKGIQEVIKIRLIPFDCSLSGVSNNRLYIGSSNGDKVNAKGMIEYVDL